MLHIEIRLPKLSRYMQLSIQHNAVMEGPSCEYENNVGCMMISDPKAKNIEHGSW